MAEADGRTVRLGRYKLLRTFTGQANAQQGAGLDIRSAHMPEPA